MPHVDTDRLETVLKDEIKRVDKQLDKAECFRSAGWIGSAMGAGFILAGMADRLPVLIAMIGAGMLLDMVVARISARKKRLGSTSRRTC
ncbi:MAG: hypothetical protein JRI36_12565 [Deltaproteobacteria bacterium]|nr:hypothetical protein [Deltaproteobacteria bacterium]